MSDTIRIVLIGKTGVGKSALGNTLLGNEAFETSLGGESETLFCSAAVGELTSGLKVKVVDTPGLMATHERDVTSEVTKSIAFLSPGPHDIIIVVKPDRFTPEERKVIKELRKLFEDESFLNYTLIVMNRKSDLKRNGSPINIHEYMENYAAEELKDLYRICKKRIAAVENSDEADRRRYAEEIITIIDKTKYYSHKYFSFFQQGKRYQEELQFKDSEIKRLQREIEDIKKKKLCSIL